MNIIALDILKEIGNIGSGNASIALSQLIDGNVRLSVPNCRMVRFDEVADVMGGPETVVTAVLVEIHGDLDGVLMMVQELKNSILMVNDITSATFSQDDLQDVEVLLQKLSPIEEIGNILIGAYISSISKMLNLTIVPSTPMMSVDMALAIMSVPASIYGEVGDEVMLLETQFANELKSLKGHFMMVPTVASQEKLVRMLYE